MKLNSNAVAKLNSQCTKASGATLTEEVRTCLRTWRSYYRIYIYINHTV